MKNFFTLIPFQILSFGILYMLQFWMGVTFSEGSFLILGAVVLLFFGIDFVALWVTKKETAKMALYEAAAYTWFVQYVFLDYWPYHAFKVWFVLIFFYIIFSAPRVINSLMPNLTLFQGDSNKGRKLSIIGIIPFTFVGLGIAIALYEADVEGKLLWSTLAIVVLGLCDYGSIRKIDPVSGTFTIWETYAYIWIAAWLRPYYGHENFYWVFVAMVTLYVLAAIPSIITDITRDFGGDSNGKLIVYQRVSGLSGGFFKSSLHPPL